MVKTWRHVIIGGGTSGLGHGLAVRLVRRGAQVTVLGRTLPADLRAVLEEAAQVASGGWQFLAADITDEAAMRRVVAEAVGAFGPADLAINSAGIGACQTVADMPVAQFSQIVAVNLTGSFIFAQAVLPFLPAGGRIALISSLAGFTSNYGYAAYGSSKFGVIGLATTLRYECEPLGIHVSCVCPPEVRTPFIEREYIDGNKIGLEMKQIAGCMELEPACDAILAGLDRGDWMIIPGIKAKLTAFAAQRMPGLFYAITSRILRGVARKHGLAAVG